MRAYLRLRRWVDEMQTGDLYSGKLLYVIGALPMFGVPIIGEWWWIPSWVFLVAWSAFITWRAWRIFKTGLVDSDSSDWVEPQ